MSPFSQAYWFLFEKLSCSSVLGLITAAVIVFSRHCNINPDNVATPIAASLGDITSLSLLSYVSTELYYCIGRLLLYKDFLKHKENKDRKTILPVFFFCRKARLGSTSHNHGIYNTCTPLGIHRSKKQTNPRSALYWMDSSCSGNDDQQVKIYQSFFSLLDLPE